MIADDHRNGSDDSSDDNEHDVNFFLHANTRWQISMTLHQFITPYSDTMASTFFSTPFPCSILYCCHRCIIASFVFLRLLVFAQTRSKAL